MNNKNNFFVDIEKIRTFDTYRIIYFVCFLFFFGLTEIGRFVYRPYIYENNLNDFGFADAVGNLGGIIVQIFFGLTILNSSRTKGLRLILFFILGYMLYEFAQPILPKGVFDWKDIFGTLIGGFAGLLLFLLLQKIKVNNRVFYKL